jgi:hypothetical protein
MASEIASVLQKLNLELLTEKFDMEKITPHIVGKLSLSEFKKLGLQNRNDIMTLRLECAKYGPEKPQRSQMNVALLSLIFLAPFWSVILIRI